MNKPKYIYLVGRRSNYEGEELEDIINYASTDFKDVIEELDYTDIYLDDDIYVMRNGENDNLLYDIKCLTKDAIEYFDKYTPDIFVDNEDEEEISYVKLHLEKWCNARKQYLVEKENMELAEKRQKEEERDRREYERLKRKYESGQET